MDISQFSILGESLIAESSEAVGSQASSQPFSPVLSDAETSDLWQRSISQQTGENISNLDQLSSIRNNCKCACHLFRNGHVSEETPCQVCCLENSDLSSSISDMISHSRPSARTSRHLSNGSSSHKITTPPNSVVSENCSDEVIVLSHSGTPPYPPPNLPPWNNRAPDWLWDWSSRPEVYPPKGWPVDSFPECPPPDNRIARIQISGLICSHIVVLLIGIYIGRRLKNS
ncbi:hypothetical protein ACHWQZ_G018284 [Mnemiopsis leidyi]